MDERERKTPATSFSTILPWEYFLGHFVSSEGLRNHGHVTRGRGLKRGAAERRTGKSRRITEGESNGRGEKQGRPPQTLPISGVSRHDKERTQRRETRVPPFSLLAGGLRSVSHAKGKNSQAAEQLWSRLDKLSFATEMSRSRYRYFFKNYAQWRNSFVHAPQFVSDVTPLVSRKRLMKHGCR